MNFYFIKLNPKNSLKCGTKWHKFYIMQVGYKTHRYLLSNWAFVYLGKNLPTEALSELCTKGKTYLNNHFL